MNKEEIKKAITNENFATLENLFFNGTEKEKIILFFELMQIIGNYNHIKNFLK